MDYFLCKLQSLNVGVSCGNLKIPAVALADDITPMADSPEKLKNIILTIDEFMTGNHMAMKPSKYAICSNLTITEMNNKLTEAITIGNIPITDIRDKNQIIRILGAFLTLNSKSEATIEHAQIQARNIMYYIKRRYTPGPIAVELVNTTVQTMLLYRLSVIPISNIKARSFDTIHMDVNKQKEIPSTQRLPKQHSLG